MDNQQARREALANRVRELHGYRSMEPWGALTVADFIIAEQERREGPLVKAIEEALDFLDAAAHDLKNSSLTDEDRASCSKIVMAHFSSIKAAIDAFHAIDAPPPPPQRTVEQIAADLKGWRKMTCTAVDALMDELAAALRRGKE